MNDKIESIFGKEYFKYEHCDVNLKAVTKKIYRQFCPDEEFEARRKEFSEEVFD